MKKLNNVIQMNAFNSIWDGLDFGGLLEIKDLTI